MSSDRDVTRIVRSWLEEGATKLPDRVLDGVLDRLPTTPQRRSWWPARRSFRMNKAFALGIAAAAVVVVAFLGIRLLLPGNSIGGPASTPTPTETPTPIPLPAAGTLEPGTYLISGADLTPRPFTVTVPAGWSTEEAFITKGDSDSVAERDVFVTPWIVTHVFADACLRPGADADSLVEVRTPEEIVEALTSQGGKETSGPTAATVGGYPAQRLEFNIPEDYDLAACDGGVIRLWPGAGPDLSSGLPIFRVGQRMSVYVVDIDGDALVLVASSTSDASATDIAELDRVVASIQFIPPLGSPAASLPRRGLPGARGGPAGEYGSDLALGQRVGMHRVTDEGEVTALFFGVQVDCYDGSGTEDPTPVRVAGYDGTYVEPYEPPMAFNNVGDEITRAYSLRVGRSTLCAYVTWHPTTSRADIDAALQILDSLRAEERGDGGLRINFTLPDGWDTG